MNVSTATADPLFRSSSLVSREAYLANKEEALTLSVLRFTLHEIRFTRTGFQAISSLDCARDPELVEGATNRHE
jgi:hypothetical protein